MPPLRRRIDHLNPPPRPYIPRAQGTRVSTPCLTWPLHWGCGYPARAVEDGADEAGVEGGVCEAPTPMRPSSIVGTLRHIGGVGLVEAVQRVLGGR